MNKALNEIPNHMEIAPYFQPILSLQTQRIIGYEALGRRIISGDVQSLGPFFKDSRFSDEEHIAVDRILRERAMEKISATQDFQLFINLKPSWIFRFYRETGLLPTLQLLDKYSFPASRLVVEVTEEDFTGNLEELSEVLDIYRQRGCSIAIDDVGSGYSSLDRIAVIRPKILKMDLNILKKSVTHEGYRTLLRSFSIISEQMGSSLLVEGIETKQDLEMAMLSGARYVQGYLFSPAAADFLPEDFFTPQLKLEIERFHQGELEKYKRQFKVERGLDDFIRSQSIQCALDADQVLERLVPTTAENGIRMYICKGDGSQVSSNYYRVEENSWSKDEHYRGANWSWRPYFIPNILMMKNKNIGLLSQPYMDLDTSSLVQTYSCPIGEDNYLFIDLTL